MSLSPSPRHILLSVAPLALAAALLSACANPSQPPLDEHRAIWTQKSLGNYTYKFNWSCFCSPDYTASVQIKVQAGKIVEITDAMTGAKLDAARFKDFRTIDGLFDFIQEAINRNAESIQVTYDATNAYPTSVSIDYIKQAVDEEMAFKASDLKAM